DGDGKVTAEEFNAFSDLKDSIRGHVTFFRVEQVGRSLFRMLDHDGDGRLGPREMNQAWARLQPWDKGGGIDRAALPVLFRLTLGHGALPAQDREAGFLLPLGRIPPRGPLWFLKMDRNGDGDVSLKEWLGTIEQFRRIDTDGDGLISLEEAIRFDR